jgi:hypothetical protein
MWWVINQISRPGGPRGPQQTTYVVVHSATRPVNAVAGPFTAQSAAQSWQSLSTEEGASPAGLASGTADQVGNDLLSGLDLGNWLLRIGEVLLGIVLIAIGMARITNAVPAATKIAKTAGAGALLA